MPSKKRLFVSKLGLVVLAFFCPIALPWRTRTLIREKSGKIPSYNLGVTCFQLDASDDWAQTRCTKPCHIMPAMPCLALPWRGEQARARVEKGYGIKTLPNMH